jgi:hypothetical protein
MALAALAAIALSDDAPSLQADENEWATFWLRHTLMCLLLPSAGRSLLMLLLSAPLSSGPRKENVHSVKNDKSADLEPLLSLSFSTTRGLTTIKTSQKAHRKKHEIEEMINALVSA